MERSLSSTGRWEVVLLKTDHEKGRVSKIQGRSVAYARSIDEPEIVELVSQ